MQRRAILFRAALTLLLITGCAKAPKEQIDAAEQAVKDAQQSGAASYAPQEYAKLEGTLTALQEEVADQDAKFTLFRDYGKAEDLVAATKQEAQQVRREAEKKKEEAKAAALQTQQVALEAVKETRELLAKAPVGKDRAALEAIKADAEALNVSLTEVQKAIDAGDYVVAHTKAKAIHEKSQAVSMELKHALAKVGKGKTAPVVRKQG